MGQQSVAFTLFSEHSITYSSINLGFELRASRLLGKCSTTQATPPALHYFNGFYGTKI
jgi:hypothetical protein